jgi:hypothetical protein
MPTNSPRKWWTYRRVQWPLGAFLFLAVVAGASFVRSNVSSVIVYNETGANITDLTLSACGQSQTFHDVADQESVRLKLQRDGSESDVAISTSGATLWRGEYIEPRGGYRILVRLRRDGQTESTTTISWWQQLLHPPASPTL